MKQQPKQRTRSTTTKRKTTKPTQRVRRKQTAKTARKETGTLLPRPSAVPPVPATPGKVSKKDAVIALLRRDDGATLAELMTVTGWQAHSVRGFISGTLRKKLGLTIESTKRDDDSVYKIAG